jgi:hypothetical protein
MRQVIAMVERDGWKDIETDLSLYKFYLELLLKAATVALALTGGVASYCLAHLELRPVKYALLLPFLVNVGFSVICAFGYRPAVQMEADHQNTCKHRGIASPYDFSPLTNLLILLAIVYAVIAGGIGTLFVIALVN